MLLPPHDNGHYGLLEPHPELFRDVFVAQGVLEAEIELVVAGEGRRAVVLSESCKKKFALTHRNHNMFLIFYPSTFLSHFIPPHSPMTSTWMSFLSLCT